MLATAEYAYDSGSTMNPSSTVAHLKVFVSYARADGSGLAEELVTALEVVGFGAYLDRHDIAAGEDWEQRLSALIREADTVLFLITPRSVASERCAWEVASAQALSKRIITVLGAVVPDAEIPAELRRLNFINFAPGASFARALAQLTNALRVDLDWIREHTRLGELARRWQERGAVDALLLRDEELAGAQSWMVGWRADLPAVTEAQRKYLAASVQAQDSRADHERQRNETMARANAERADALERREHAMRLLKRRTILAGVGVGTLSLGMAGTALWAVRQRERALEAHIRRESQRQDIAGQIVAYAASPGQMAIDSGARKTSPYTTALLEELAQPNTSLWGALSVTSMRVNRESKGQQRPFVSSDMNGDLYLGQPSPTRRQRALVIAVGNFRHIRHMRFDGVYRDLEAWAGFLRARRFEVAELRDPTLAQLNEALDALRVTHASELPPRLIRTGVSPLSEPNQPPADSLLLVFYAGFGFLSGALRYLAGTDVQGWDAKGTNDPMASSALNVADLETRVRERAAASVLVYDTQFL